MTMDDAGNHAKQGKYVYEWERIYGFRFLHKEMSMMQELVRVKL
jgi:hypothetical protein